MKAVFIDRFGGPDVLRFGEFPEPRPGPHDLLVEVRAASVNPVDFKIREGALQRVVHYRPPFVLGNDLSGVVRAVGPEVTRFRSGDEIFARLDKTRIGTWTELAVVGEADAAAKPKNLSHVEAAALPLVALTAWQALVEIGDLQAGQRVLIQAGSGGVGTLAIQLARHLGAHVFTTASSRSRALLESLGAERVIDYRTEAFEDVVRDADVVFDTQGGDTLHRCFSAVRPGGTVVTVGGRPDSRFAREWGMPLPAVLVLGFLGRKTARLAREKRARFRYLFMRADGGQLEKIGALIEQGKLKPVLDRTFPFAEAKAALAYSEAGRAVGKVVLTVGEGERAPSGQITTSRDPQKDHDRHDERGHG